MNVSQGIETLFYIAKKEYLPPKENTHVHISILYLVNIYTREETPFSAIRSLLSVQNLPTATVTVRPDSSQNFQVAPPSNCPTSSTTRDSGSHRAGGSGWEPDNSVKNPVGHPQCV